MANFWQFREFLKFYLILDYYEISPSQEKFQESQR